MIRRIALLIATTILASTLVAPQACSQAAGARILTQLTQATEAQLRTRAYTIANDSPKEASQLALDLVVYRWASRLSGRPADVKNITAIIKALSRELNDPAVDWSVSVFTTAQGRTKIATVPSQGDERASMLSELRVHWANASEYRDKSPIQAESALRSVLDICQRLRLDITRALAQKELGDRYYEMSRFHEAEMSYNWSIWLFLLYDCSASSATVYDDLGTLNAEIGRYSKATENYTMAAQQWMLLAGQDPSGYRYRDFAGQEYMKAGDALRAAGETDKALEIMTTYGLNQLGTWAHATKSYAGLISNLIKVAGICIERGNIRRAVDLLGSAKRAGLAHGDPLLMARIYEEFAKVYAVDGKSVEAAEAKRKRKQVLDTATSAGEIAASKLEKYPNAAEAVKSNLRQAAERGAGAYQALGDYVKSSDLWRRIATIYQKSGLIDKRIAALRSLAAVLDLQQEPAASLEVRLDAALTARKAGKKTLAADIVQDMVQALIEIGDLQNALEAFTELVPIIEAAGNVRGVAKVLDARGTLLATHGENESAVRYLQDARARYLTQVGDTWAAGEVSLKLAGALSALKKTDESRAMLETALDGLEDKYANENLDPSSDPKRAGLMMDLYRELASALIHAGKTEDADKLLKNAKRYMWLPELVNRMKGDPSAPVAKFAQDFDLISGTNSTNGGPDATVRRRVLADNWGAFYEACWMLGKQYPANYTALPVDPLEIFKFRHRLPADSTIVEYMLTDSSVYVFECGPGKSICRELGVKSGDLDMLVSELRKVLKGCEESLRSGIPVPPISDWNGPAFADIRKPLEGLYDQLIDPIRKDLGERRMVIFVLPKELSGLPMHALVSVEPGKGTRFIIQDYEVGYLGAGMIEDFADNGRQGIDPVSDRLAIFADPGQDLPGAQAEAKLIKSIYINSQWYIGARATAESFISECRRVSVIHVAAHYTVDPNPTKFRLAMASQGGSDGGVGIQELAGLENSHLKLVVLSACNSVASLDPVSSGPSRAAEVFSRVGAESVLGGLWNVSDEAASSLMGDFYRTLNKQDSRAGALRRAQLNMIESESGQFAHPFYWACFALYGNPR
ncbi:MAG: CHAT domain-containing protein [Armatimonadetes bacterium]|nr:CHAT domain-containing protein [Armatimonadota bacterium]